MSMNRGRNESCAKDGTELERHTSFIDFTEPPSLQSIAIVSIAVRLWTEPDMSEIAKQNIDVLHSRCDFDKVEERVLNKLTSVILPDRLKIKVSNIIRPIGMQLLEPNYHYLFEEDLCNFHDISKIGGSVYYTMEGVIDKVKSLKELMANKDQIKDFGCLYKLACKYCLEENISYLWGEIYAERKETFRCTYDARYEYRIVSYWTAYLENDLPNFFSKIKFCDSNDIYDTNHSLQVNMTSTSVFVGNVFSLRYFWQKLTVQEKNINIENWINMTLQKLDRFIRLLYDPKYQQCNPFADILFFLFSKLNNQNKLKSVFQTHSRVILKSLFFYWPWQRFFLQTISVMFDYLPNNVYIEIMLDITDEIKEGKTTGELFREVWHLSPLKLKASFRPFIEGALWNLFEVNDIRTIDMLLSNASSEEKKDMALNIINYDDFRPIILSGKFTFFDTMINKLLPLDYETERFKASMIFEHTHIISLLILRGDVQRVDEWLKWGFSSENEIQCFKKKNINPFKIYISLIRLENYERINKFLIWYFETEDGVTSFKKAFVGEDNFPRCFNLLIEMSDDYITGWNKLERFLDYSLSSSEEVSKFKKLYLKSVPNFVKRGHLEFATKFLNWCFDSSDEVNQFKNELLLSKKGVGMLLYRLNHTYFSWESLQHILRWFFPLSSETIEKLKSLKDSRFFGYKDCYAPENKKQAFIYVLECFALKYNTSDCVGGITDYIDAKSLKSILKGNDINADCDSDSSYTYDSEDSNVYVACEDDDIYDLSYY